MNALEKLELIDRVGRELQSKMTYEDINQYLNAHEVNTKKPTSNSNSKWVYVKELLSDEEDSLIIDIANELQITHNFTTTDSKSSFEAAFWEPSHFKLFLSHISSFKETTSQLQSALRTYGISAFVAHVDIEPTKEWQNEIEAGLYSMEALAAILMPGFKDSSWTDQEVGIAMGRGVLVIPIMRGSTPYGFISKYQGLDANGKSVAQVAKSIFRILTSSPKTRKRMISCLIETTIRATSTEEAITKLKHIESIQKLSPEYLKQLRNSAKSSVALSSEASSNALNNILIKHDLKPISNAQAVNQFENNDIPF